MFDNTYLFIDFDSTFITCETLEELALVSLKGRSDKDLVIKTIKIITNLGMEGKIPFEESLKKRMWLLRATKKDVEETIKFLKKKVTPSIKKNRSFFSTNKDHIYIISGAFKECVYPVVKTYGILESHVLANALIFDQKGNIIGADTTNPLAGKNGKYLAVKALRINETCLMVKRVSMGFNYM